MEKKESRNVFRMSQGRFWECKCESIGGVKGEGEREGGRERGRGRGGGGRGKEVLV